MLAAPRAGSAATHRRVAQLENGGLYWHLVDVIWIFLLPLFYLAACEGRLHGAPVRFRPRARIRPWRT